MSTPVLGAGLAPAGVTPAGFGAPATATVLSGTPLSTQAGTVHGSPFIATDAAVRGMFVYDTSSGERVGMPDIRHLVQLAASTVRGASAVPAIGSTFNQTRKIAANFAQAQRRRAEETFSHLIAAGLVRIDRVQVDTSRPGSPVTTVYLTELATGQAVDQVL